MPMSAAREERATGGREALIDAMARKLAERGYPETRVEEVAAEAGLEQADFERFFADKEECALAAVELILVAGMEAVAKSYSADTSEWESALTALRDLLQIFSERPAYAGLAFIGSRQGMTAGAEERYRSGFAILTAMLDRLREDRGHEVQAPPTAARAAIGGGEALVRRELVRGQAAQLPRILPDLIYSATVPFLGQREALRLARRARRLSPRGS
jgi:AcrR family transcriptional regulator